MIKIPVNSVSFPETAREAVDQAAAYSIGRTPGFAGVAIEVWHLRDSLLVCVFILLAKTFEGHGA
jgi:hypothetical protein